MKIVKYATIGLLFLGMTTLMGCKKEDKIERNLWNQSGEWNIVKNTWWSSFDFTEKSEINTGSFKFEKNGNGKVTTNDGANTYSNFFKYENTENSLTLTFEDGYKEKYTLDWKKDKIQLRSSTKDVNPDGVTTYYTDIFDLEKKK